MIIFQEKNPNSFREETEATMMINSEIIFGYLCQDVLDECKSDDVQIEEGSLKKTETFLT